VGAGSRPDRNATTTAHDSPLAEKQERQKENKRKNLFIEASGAGTAGIGERENSGTNERFWRT
jgi:hypothetical protein